MKAEFVRDIVCRYVRHLSTIIYWGGKSHTVLFVVVV